MLTMAKCRTDLKLHVNPYHDWGNYRRKCLHEDSETLTTKKQTIHS